ncbi:hypothetical protein KFE25_007731 [Diacronema lutheri]|uniref:RRM domain-containing protein n=2 Tax=Diacronema lutheri TaxID=2081491 RepID=A0A8J5XPP4_DIALT|nr:hypothetical protein KFE25_007731 [Diacronema lutheri]
MFRRRATPERSSGGRPAGRMGRFMRRMGERHARTPSEYAQQSVPAIEVTGGAHDRVEKGYDDEVQDDAHSTSESVVDEFLEWLGIPPDEPQFRWIGADAAATKLPAEWEELEDEGGKLFWEHVSGEVSDAHPNYVRFRALYEAEVARARKEAQHSRQRYLVATELPADGADGALEDALAETLGGEAWESLVLAFTIFVDNDNTRCALIRVVDANARDALRGDGSAVLGGAFRGWTVPLEAVEDVERVRRMELLARESRCVTVTNLPAGIDNTGLSKLFALCRGDFWWVRIEDLSGARGARALIEFTESIAARRTLAFNMFRMDGRFLHVTLGSSVA